MKRGQLDFVKLDFAFKARLHRTATLWRHRRCHGGLQNIRGRRRTAMNLIFEYFFVNDTVFGRHSGGITQLSSHISVVVLRGRRPCSGDEENVRRYAGVRVAVLWRRSR